MYTLDRVMIFAFCTSSDDILSMYQVLFNPLVYFQRYAPDKLLIAKINKSCHMLRTSFLLQKLTRAVTRQHGSPGKVSVHKLRK